MGIFHNSLSQPSKPKPRGKTASVETKNRYAERAKRSVEVERDYFQKQKESEKSNKNSGLPSTALRNIQQREKDKLEAVAKNK